MQERPRSAVREGVGYAGAIGALVAVAVGIALEMDSALTLMLLVIGAALPMWWMEWRTDQDHYDIVDERADSIFGVAFILLTLAACMFLQLRFGGSKGAAVSALVPSALVVSLLMVLASLTCPSSLSPTIAACGRASRTLLRASRPQYADVTAMLGWLVKCFFMPLMLAWAWVWLSKFQDQWRWGSSLHWYVGGLTILYAIDTSFAIVGYGSTSHRIGGQIRSVDRTALGWISALACYPPLGAVVLDGWLIVRHANDWEKVVESSSWLYIPWGVGILGLTVIYAWSSVAFGPRFSNLTNRGIITSGPYRWTKHPAYLSKNLSWWMISVPFISTQGWRMALLQCIAMLAVNAIYWIRAKTEERHLMRDAAYRDYAAWIERNGIFAYIRRRSYAD